jgi:hypothetical protein
MKNILLILPIIFTVVACSTTGYQTAPHNGKVYYIPPNCPKYQYKLNDPDTLYCFDKQGNQTSGILTPASNEQVQLHLMQQEANRRAWEDINNTIKQATPKTTNCYNIAGMLSCSTY